MKKRHATGPARPNKPKGTPQGLKGASGARGRVRILGKNKGRSKKHSATAADGEEESIEYPEPPEPSH
eukprot:6724939-Prorocentrum_lima.AAC.1